MKLVDENVIIDRVAYSTSKSEISHEDLVVSVRYLLNRKNEYDTDSNQGNNSIAGGSSSSSSDVGNWVDLTSDQTISGVKTFASGLFVGNVRLVEDNGSLKIEKGVYSTSFMSSYGKSSGGSGAGGFNRLDDWSNYKESSIDDEGNPIEGTEGWVLSAKLGYELYNNLAGTWDKLRDKPFTYLDTETFEVTNGTLKLKKNLDNYIGTTKTQEESKPQALTGITNIDNLLYFNDNKIGVGLSNPSYEFDVSGTIAATSLVLGTGTKKVTLSVDTNGYLKINKGTYSESFISSYGLNGENKSGGIEWGGISGTGNVITDVSFNNGQISFVKGNISPESGGIDTIDITPENNKAVTNVTKSNDGKTLSFTLSGPFILDSAIAAWAKESTPKLYIGTTLVQQESKSQALTGVSSIDNLIHISSSNYVGIGTNNPSLKLSVLADSYEMFSLKRNTAYGSSMTFDNSGGRLGRFGYSSGEGFKWDLGTSNNSAMLLSSSGLGIGITSVCNKKIYFGDTNHYIELTNNGFHFSHGVYSESFVSAYGVNGSNASGGSVVSFTQTLTSGTIIGTIKINGTPQTIYAPNGGASSWSEITGKPFTSLGTGLTVTDGVLSATATGGVTSVGNQTGAITLRGGQTVDGSVNLAMSGQQIQASIVGWNNLALKTDLSKLYWANVAVSTTSNDATSPTFAGATVTGASTFNFSGIESASSNIARVVWFAHSSKIGTPVYNSGFTYNPGTYELAIATTTNESANGGTIKIKSSANNPYVRFSEKYGTTVTNWYVQAYNGYLQMGAGSSKSVRIDTKGNLILANGDQTVILSCDTNGYLKVNHGLYSESFVSAYGVNGSTGGGTVSGDYLPLTGGTIKNESGFGEQLELFRNVSGGGVCIKFTNKDSVLGYLGVNSESKPVWLPADRSAAYELLYGDTFKVTRGKDIDVTAYGYYAGMTTKGPSSNWYHVISMDWTGADNKNWISQLALPTQQGGVPYYRHNKQGTSISSATWHTFITDENISSQSVNYATSAGSATSATTASKLSTVSKTAWGQTYWTSGGVPTSISGNMTGVGNITANGNYSSSISADNDLSVGVTNSNGSVSILTAKNRGLYSGGWIIGTNGTNSFLMKGSVGINTTTPGHWLDVNGSARVSGNLYISTNSTYTPRIWYDSTNNCLRTNVGFVSESFVSSFGLGNTGVDKITFNSLPIELTASGDEDESFLNIKADGIIPYVTASYLGSSTKRFHLFATNIDASANVIIRQKAAVGYTNVQSSYQFAVNGDCNFNGTVYVKGSSVHTSDIRLKQVYKNIEVDITDIAKAPSIEYSYKDNLDIRYIGTTAQYWKNLISNVVKEDDNGWLSLDYNGITIVSCISLAKAHLNHEYRIKLLEQENKILKQKLFEIENKL